MKKALSVILCLCLALSTFSIVSVALSTEGSNVVSTGYYDSTELPTELPTEAPTEPPIGENEIRWRLDGTVLTIYGNGNMDDYDIYDNEKYEYDWTSQRYQYRYYYQAPWIKYYKDNIETVVIEEGVTSISRYAFYGCSNIKSVTIPSSVTWIGRDAFSGCTGITEVHINDFASWCNITFSFTEYNDDYNDDNNRYSSGTNPLEFAHNLYLNNELITDLVIPDGVTYIGSYTFYGCTGLTSVTIPNTVKQIDIGAFYGCTNLSGVYISDIASWCDIYFRSSHYSEYDYRYSYQDGTNPLQYAQHLYLNNELVTDLVIPDTVNEINSFAFYGCTDLTSVDIANSVTQLGDYVFSGCSNLKTVILNQAGVDKFKSAFSDCDIENVILKEGVSSINAYSSWSSAILYRGFSDYKSIKSITIPTSVMSIDINAFRGCSGLTNISIDSGNRLFNSRDNCNAIIDTRTNKLMLGCANTVIPDSVTSIGGSAFSGCTGLTSIDIPKSVTSIGSSAFSDCTGLTSIDIPKSVTSIGSSAFSDCTGLTNASINGSIGDKAFGCCANLTTVTLGSSVRSIGSMAFCGDNSLSGIYIPASVTSIGEKALGYYAELNYWGELINVKQIEDFTIYGYDGSQAYDYAWYNYLDFVALSNLLGDADGNGELDIVDETYIQRYLVDIPIPYTKGQLMSGDVDGSGDLELTDVTAIQYYLANLKTPYKIGEPIQQS